MRLLRGVAGAALAVALLGPAATASGGSAVVTLKATPAPGSTLTASQLDDAAARARAKLAQLRLGGTVALNGAGDLVVRLPGVPAGEARVVAATLSDTRQVELYDLTPSLLPPSLDRDRNPVAATNLHSLLRRAPADATIATCSASFAAVCPGLLTAPARNVTYYYLLRPTSTPPGSVVPGSATAGVDPTTGSPIVTLKLSAKGNELFRRFTRAEARRGQRLGVLQSLAIVVDGEVRSFPSIDYLAYPNGIEPAGEGIQLTGLVSTREAKELAAELHGKPSPVRLSVVRVTTAP